MLQNSDPETTNWIKDIRDDSADIKSLGQGECLIESIGNNGQLVSTKEQVNGAHKTVARILQVASKPLCNSLAIKQKIISSVKRGASGLPLSVEQTMLEERSQRSGDLEMRYELIKMRQKSLRGEKYWEHKECKIQPEKTIVPSTEGFHLL